MKLKILHISDLHYRKELKNNDVVEAFFKDISNLDIDFVFFTGDITFSGTKDDFISFTNDFYAKPVKKFAKERIIFCPGNHDVDRNQIKTILGKPIVEQIHSSDELSQVIIGHKTHWFYTTNRLKNYFKFLGKISSSYKSNTIKYSYTDFYTNYIYEINGKKIGITSFNSSWLAEGGQKDFGKLAIGESNVSEAYKMIEKCDIKLCLFHHPKEWFMPYDKSISLIKKNYNFAFNGHNHEANPEIYSTPHNKLIQSNTGCLYESENFYNGYTVLEISDKEIAFSVRTYYPARKEYDQAINLFKNGIWKSAIEKLPMIDLDKMHFSIFQEQALKSLITIENDNRNFIERFVYPNISKESFFNKKALNKDENKKISKKDLFDLSNNLMIHGKQESGKTCFLYYIGWELFFNKKQLPFYINLTLLEEKGNDPFYREIRNIANDSNIKDIEKRLQKGNCVILLDNLSEKETAKNNKLKSFIQKYPDNTFISSVNQFALDSFDSTKNKPIIESFNNVYIHSFEVKNIRELINVIKPNAQKEETNLLVENISSLLSRTGLPYNPTMISIILDIQVQIGHFTPINKASLLDKLIEILLKKHDVLNVSRGSFDYENQLDLLANFANILYIKETQYTVVQFERFINDYLQQIGIDDITSYSLIDSFIKSNILVQNGSIIQFKIKSFQHFFFAKYLHLYPDDIDAIKSGYNYLRVSESIDYLTGLERKNKDLLDFILAKLEQLFKEVEFEYDINSFNDLNISNGFLTELMDDKIIEDIDKRELPDKQKDEFTQMRYPESQNELSELDIEDPKDRYKKCLELSCNVIRNCELIKDIEYRSVAVKKVIKHWASILVEIILSINNDEELIKEIDDDDKEEFRKLINVILPITFQNEIMETIGSSKLKSVIKGSLNDSSLSKIERLLLILILEEIDASTNFEMLTNFLNKNNDSYYLREIIFTYLLLLHDMKPMSKTKRNKCIRVMSEIIAQKEGGGYKQKEEYVKQQFVDKMKKKAGNKG